MTKDTKKERVDIALDVELGIEAESLLDNAIRQYQHTDNSGFLVGFDHDETVKIVTELCREMEAKEKKIKELQAKLDEHTHLARTMGAISVHQMYNDYKTLCDSRRNT